MWAIREYQPSDFNFIAHSFLRSQRGSREARAMIDSVYYPAFKERLETMLRISKVHVICAEADLDQIAGYLLTSKIADWDVLHYVYVKHPFRRLGLAKDALTHVLKGFGERPTICTHLPKNWPSLAEKYKLIFDPKYVRDK